MASQFKGFQENKERFTGIPELFFRELLPALTDLNEMKICLYVLWKAYTIGDFRKPISVDSILLDTIFTDGLIRTVETIEDLVANKLEKAADDHILIRAENGSSGGENIFYINCPSGRKAASQFSGTPTFSTTTLDQIQPNIFQLYQENIGPLTPLIADALKKAEEIYPNGWIKEAIQIAVQNNVRRWKYVESILDRWQKEGRDGTDREYDQEDYRRYIKGEYGEIGHH